MSELLHHGVLVIGGGLAGLRTAVAAQEAGSDVAVLSNVYPIRSSTLPPSGGDERGGEDRSEGPRLRRILPFCPQTQTMEVV